MTLAPKSLNSYMYIVQPFHGRIKDSIFLVVVDESTSKQPQMFRLIVIENLKRTRYQFLLFI